MVWHWRWRIAGVVRVEDEEEDEEGGEEENA